MAVFSRKPSKEATLQRIYTDAYEASLQSILKESCFDYIGSLAAWKETLAQITSGMATLDGSPPKTAQERSLLSGIMDTERQCHDRIAALEKWLEPEPQTPATNPYGTNSGASTTLVNVSELSVHERPGRVAVGAKTNPSERSLPATPKTAARSEPALESPKFDFSDHYMPSSAIPKVSDMPYKMYSRRPAPAPSNPVRSEPAITTKNSGLLGAKAAPAKADAPTTTSAKINSLTTATPRSSTATIVPVTSPNKSSAPTTAQATVASIAPLSASSASTPASTGAPVSAMSGVSISGPTPVSTPAVAPKPAAKTAAPPQRSSLDYPQAQGTQYGHTMLHTLRARNPLKVRAKHAHTNSVTRATPSPRTSADSLSIREQALSAAKTTASNQSSHRNSPVHQPSYLADTGLAYLPSNSQASNASASNAQAPASSTPANAQSRQSYLAEPFTGFEGSFVSDSQPTSPVLADNVEFPSRPTSPFVRQKQSQFQVAYEKVSNGTGRTVYRPRVVRTSNVAPQNTSKNGSTPAGSSNTYLPAANSGTNLPASNPGSTPYSGSSSSLANLASTSNPSLASKSAPALVPATAADPDSSSDAEDEDEWTKAARAKIKTLRGVDKNAAEQIINEVVLKGDKVSWDDIAGLERAKASLKETVVYPFLRPDLFMGLREPVLGMLLFGPPGTGKTMLARAVAAESKSTFFSISASSLTSKFMGESEKLVRALFQIAKALAPSIIFVDEIDSILAQRADSGEHEASRRIKNEFLVQWSDLQSAAAGKNNNEDVRRVLVLGATNLPWGIDEAARRRFVRRQYIPLPEPFTRHVHLQKLLSHQKHALSSEDLDLLTELTDGYSGSDLTALAKDAAMGPLRSLGDALLTTAQDQIRPMNMSDFVESMKSIRPSVSPEGLSAFEQWASMYGSSGA